jgi:hypothetical protein
VLDALGALDAVDAVDALPLLYTSFVHPGVLVGYAGELHVPVHGFFHKMQFPLACPVHKPNDLQSLLAEHASAHSANVAFPVPYCASLVPSQLQLFPAAL